MSWFSKSEDYTLEDTTFYGEPEITYGKQESSSSSTPATTSGAWDDYQHEREYISSSMLNDNYSR